MQSVRYNAVCAGCQGAVERVGGGCRQTPKLSDMMGMCVVCAVGGGGGGRFLSGGVEGAVLYIIARCAATLAVSIAMLRRRHAS